MKISYICIKNLKQIYAMKIEKYLNRTQILETCDKIRNGITREQLAKELNIAHSTACRLFNRLVDKYKLNDDIYIPYHPSLKPLSQEEYDVLIGGLLGDTWLGYLGKSKHVSGSFTHKLEHEDYVRYKYKYLKRLCSIPTIHNKFDKRTNREYQQVFCKIATNPILDPIVEAFYKEKKVINQEYIEKLSPLGIAIWYMDDGGPASYGYKFSVDCFELEDIKKLSNLLSSKFGIGNTIYNNQNKVIHIGSSYTTQFKKLIEPYICECMKYKLQVYKSSNEQCCLVNI